MRQSVVVLAGCLVLAGSGCTASSMRSALDLKSAPNPCPEQTFPLHQSSPRPLADASAIVHGHVPSRLPRGFRVQQVSSVQPGGAGYVAWTDGDCRRVSVFFQPGESTAAGSVHAFGPWMKLQSCGDPKPCMVYQGVVAGGLVTFATRRLDADTVRAVLRSLRT